MLEQQQAQLVTGLQELYKRTQSSQGWTGAPLKESSNGNPLTHDILERLGALKQDSHTSSEAFEEDLSLMQQRLIAIGAGYMQRTESSDGKSEAGHSLMFDNIPTRQQIFSDSFSFNQSPPTPPQGSPFPQSVQPAPVKSHSYVQPTPMQAAMNPALLQRQSWSQPHSMGFDNDMDIIRRYDSPVSFDGMHHGYTSQMPMNADPCLPMDWNETEFKTFFNPTLL
jgi:hypothetical protein